MSLIGNRVAIIARDHPHAGKVGTVVSIDRVAGDTALKVEFDGAYDGGAYVFPGEWKLIW